MSAAANHPGDAVQDFLDGRLDAAGHAALQAHLRSCARCRRELAVLRRLKRSVALQADRQAIPAGLHAAIQRTLSEEDSRVAGSRPLRARPRLRWATGFALAATAALASVLLWTAQSPAGLPAAAVKDFTEFRAGKLPVEMQTAQADELEQFLTRGIGFETRVFDLGAMSYRVAGGRLHRLQGRASALFVYQGAGDARLLCQMYQGRMDELPPPAERVERNGISFQVYRQDGLTAVFWAEAGIICVLVSDLDPDVVLRLAIAKAVTV